jgi:hypothetical protein
LPAPWVPLSHTIMGPDASALRAAGTGTAEIRYGFGVSGGGVNHRDRVSPISKVATDHGP